MDAEHAEARGVIEAAWTRGGAECTPTERTCVETVMAALDEGALRVAEPPGPDSAAREWVTREWVKKAILLSFRIRDSAVMPWAGGASAYDKVPLKVAGWDAARFARAGFRITPGAIVRHSAFVAPGAVLMPCFVNVGARIGEGTMIDTWATVGSCAQIGRNCHVSGGAGIGGVLEPVQARPVVIEDDCFVGARSEVAEGVIVERGAVLGMGVFIGASTKIVDRATGEVFRGRVPAYSVVVPGTLGGGPDAPALGCAVIVKRVDARTRGKTAINELLRD